jgi:hypothetical protein
MGNDNAYGGNMKPAGTMKSAGGKPEEEINLR